MKNIKSLVVYYSRSGTTRLVAEFLAAALSCDIQAIVETKDRHGLAGWIRSAIEANRRIPSSTIAAANTDPSSYDIVIIGTPVWAWSLSSPVRAYMAANRARLPAVAFFCTLGGAGGARTFAQMQTLAGKEPRACVTVRAVDVMKRRHAAKLAPFIQALKASKITAMAA